MSQDAITGFWKRIGTDEALRAEFDALLSSNETIPAEEIVAFAGRQGLAFTKDELKASLTQATGGELSDAELDAAAGGCKWYVPELDSDQSGMAAFKRVGRDDFGTVTF